MSIPFKIHTATVYSSSEGGQTQDWSGTGVEVSCQITPLTSGVAYSKWGVECKRPFQLMADPDQESIFDIGYRVTWNGKDMTVVGAPQTYTDTGVCDHTLVLLEVEGSA